MKNDPSLYMIVHEYLRPCTQIRNVRQSIDIQYSVDLFLKSITIHHQAPWSHPNTKGTVLMTESTLFSPHSEPEGALQMSDTTPPTTLIETSFADTIRA